MTEKPELADGYGRIANEIMDALSATYMSSYESQFIWCLFRHTYGWNKKEDFISLSQIAASTGMHLSHVSRTKKKLLHRRIVTQTGNRIAFNKYHSQWMRLPKQVTVTQTGTPAHSGNQTPPIQVNTPPPIQAGTKDTTKNNIQKQGADAPALYSEKFFAKDAEVMKAEAQYFVAQGVPVEVVRQEFGKFVHYWQEKTQGGRKERWQTEKTFEVRRRLVTWLTRTMQQYQKKGGSLNMPDFRSQTPQ